MSKGLMASQSLTINALQTPVQQLPSIGPQWAPLLRRLGIHKAVDLLFHFPRGYQEPARLQSSDRYVENARVSVVGTVQETAERVTQAGKHIFGALLATDDKALLRLTWFNQPFRKNDVRVGQRFLVSGVLRSTVLNWEMVQPQLTPLAAGVDPQDPRPLPIYPLTDGLKQPMLRKLMRDTLPELFGAIDEALPFEVRDRLNVPDVQTALRDLHFPDSLEAALAAQKRFKLQELLVLQLAISLKRRQREQLAAAPPCEPTGKIHARILNRLGLTLTQDQLRAIADIGADMRLQRPMNRLLQGDVGSGKTIVAQYAMLLAAAYGHQAALMAPTEILARQHADTLQRSLASSRVRVGLLTGSLPKAERRQILESVAEGTIDLLVGTQALLSGDVNFKNLGLVIVDEQHKFGVVQRAKLRSEESQPHYLVLSATPIPRTIAMTAFGDLDVSTIREKPPGRAPVNSYVASTENLESWWQFVDAQILTGRQAYVIAPRIAENRSAIESEQPVQLEEPQQTEIKTDPVAIESLPNTGDGDSEIATAQGSYDKLRQGVLSHRRIGLLHGKLDSREKESVLGSFASGQLDVLVATTVVEVGIDVPNATVMTILDADKLGLSQLHQLRGRVSRGSHTGFVCAVASAGSNLQDNQRLETFEKSNDGFELAEMDLKLRGPGDLLGTSQSGMPPLRIANLVDDAPLLLAAREMALEILDADPDLSQPQHEKLRRQTHRRYGASMQLSDVG